MGVKGLLKELPCGDMEDQRFGFLTLHVLHGPTRKPADIDTGTLVFVYTLRHKEVYNKGYCVPASRNHVDHGIGPQSHWEAPKAGESTGSLSGESTTEATAATRGPHARDATHLAR